MTTERLQQYYELLEMSYDDAVKTLLTDHGAVPGDYFIEKSYNKWVAGENKLPGKNKNLSRTDEGLEIHQNAEDEYEDMGNPVAIEKQDIPFSLQKADTLCYVDKWEHTILHALIAIKTKGQHGLPGFNTYLMPIVKEWYIDEKAPSDSAPQWYKNSYNAAKLDKKEATELLTKIVNMLDEALKDVRF
ncbi:hypothetical protein NFX39_05965 [Fructobacillus sp. W13]|uniref:Phage protein n=1 Tax=Fructobacillus apis TaxID=2935017 RepID=A0ABT0ZRM5_9LACO|nr:hypothetical protein [Fructobacillus apis]MCO0832622.1 hypothetical protein [Fructobacillus apis]